MEFVNLRAQRERIRDSLDRRLADVFADARFILGPEVTQLEGELARRAGVSHVVTCASGTDALALALRAFGIGLHDAVLVPSFTFAATAGAVAITGATPIFLDVDAETFTLDPSKVADGVAAARRCGLTPRAVIPVDLFGQPADYGPITEAANENELVVIADAAQSFGATYDGGSVGSLAAVTTTSFFPSKPLGCYGDGGAIFTDDEALAEIVRSLRVHGRGRDKYDNVRVGTNSRLDTIQAAVLLAKLEVFDDELRTRGSLAGGYSSELEGLEGIVSTPRDRPGSSPAWAQYTIGVDNRDRVRSALAANGIPTAVYYPRPLHQQAAFSSFPAAGPQRVSERLAECVLSLPFHPYLTLSDQMRVVEELRASCGRHSTR